MKTNAWHTLAASEVVERLATDPDAGLTGAEAARRLAEDGPNELIEHGATPAWRLLLGQFSTTLVVVLIVAAAASAALGDLTDAVAIGVILVLNAILGFTLEYRAERAIAAIQKISAPTVQVRRDGGWQEIPAPKLVRGDVIRLDTGDLVPADGRLVKSANLRIQESVLTGESDAVEKNAETTVGDVVLGDRINSVFRGTLAVYGNGEAIITETGMATELGRIAEMIQNVEQTPTPLQKRLSEVGRWLAAAALALVAVIFVLGLLRGDPVKQLLLTAISLAVAAVPEGLPAVVTIALALGSQRMLRRNALIRRLPAVEPLGAVTTICSDKTGTLTQNRMTVTVLDIAGQRLDLNEDLLPQGTFGGWARGESSAPLPLPAHISDSLVLLLVSGALCNDAVLERRPQHPQSFRVIGDPTEGALVAAAERAGFLKGDLDRALPRVAEVPFDSDRRRMTTLHRYSANAVLPEGVLAFAQDARMAGDFTLVCCKGAPGSMLEASDRIWSTGRIEPLTDEWRARIRSAADDLAGQGMRVLGVAARVLPAVPETVSVETVEHELISIGLVGMIDPARPEAKAAVETCKQAGIRPVMITGDHPRTASFIAADLGIDTTGRVMTGAELAGISDADLEQQVEEIPVFARVSPEHKLIIIQALQKRGHIVAMTGDGVNDAPALRKADIGVAMGLTGTDVAKEAADIVLIDDNFATLVAAVQEGRVIYDNIRKFIKYLIGCNSGEIWVMLLGPLFGIGLPLLPLQILWMNLVTDGLPALALAMEPAEPNTMRRPPHRPNESIFARGLGRDVLWIGFLIAAISLGVGLWFRAAGRSEWQTALFCTMVFAQMAFVLGVRSERSIVRSSILANSRLALAVIASLALQIGVVYLPFAQPFFKTVPLPPGEMATILVAGGAVLLAIEIQKAWFARRRTTQP